MRRVKVGIRKKSVDYQYREYCFAIINYNRNYYIIKNNTKYSFIGDKIKDKEDRKECIERIIKWRTNLLGYEYEDYVTIDEYIDKSNNKGIESFATFYLIHINKPLEYKIRKNEELLLVNKDELLDLINISYQKEALKIIFATFMFN